MITVMGDNDYKNIYDETSVESRHFTMVFNVFVVMQLFNFINSRKIHEEINLFSGILSNKLFIVIVFCILILQGLLVTFGGSAVHVYGNYGLTI